jgi:UDPglucose 6-dehydrogenase|tara:strand:+ start:19714 stop:20535 length:822 start_codon:yes stop_codon:yes gene_type:complete
MKKIGIVGHGYVGEAMGRFFENHYDLKIYDPKYTNETLKEPKGLTGKNGINECDMAVVCVPTPMNDDGSCDLSILDETMEWLEVDLILVKSTTTPGSLQQYVETGKNIVFSPEYIGEGKYNIQWWKDKGYPHPTDMTKHDFFIFGGEKWLNEKAIQFFMKVTGPGLKYMQTDINTAQLVKYMVNCWGATKVTFCNEFYDIARSLDISYEELRELFLLDGRTERMHTAVFSDKRGYDGKCYPKDINATAKFAEEADVSLLKAVIEKNKKYNPDV